MTTYARRPREYRAAHPMTEPQSRLLASLVSERVLTGTVYVGWDVALPADLDRRKASKAITAIMALPRRADVRKPAPAIFAGGDPEPGFYVHGDDAFRVMKNRAGTHTYAKHWDGHSWTYAPGAKRLLGGMTPMSAEKAAALGLASGKCIVCLKTLGGEVLEARVAALIGYGAKCAANNGWYFPKGVDAQRAYIAKRA